MYPLSRAWTGQSGGLARCIVFVESATLLQFVYGFNTAGTPSKFGASWADKRCARMWEIPPYQFYCLQQDQLEIIRDIVRVIRPSTVPKMILLFEVIVKLFHLQQHLPEMIQRGTEAIASTSHEGSHAYPSPTLRSRHLAFSILSLKDNFHVSAAERDEWTSL